MRKVGKYFAALFAAALFSVMLAGCSGQAASSSASAEPQTTEDLIAELEQISENNDYKSVTMDMEGEVSIDYSAMLGGLGGDEGDSSSDSADASDSSTAAEAASDSSESADAEGSDDDSALSIPMNIKAKCDMSSGAVKMYMTMNMMGQDIELYIDGDNAVMVMAGQAVSATLDELGMSDYKSIDSIMESQGANIDQFKDSISQIEKSTEGDETLYKIVCDPSKFASDSEALGALSQVGADAALSTAEVTYRVNADGKLVGMDMKIAGTGISSDVKTTLYDYDATEVPDAPEATMSYSEMVNGGDDGADDDSSDVEIEDADDEA